MNAPSNRRKSNTSNDAADLRRRAELQLRGRKQTSMPNQATPQERRQIHEVEVHQIELEMQNEELRESREVLEGLLDKYSDHYDFSPAGYLTLDREGVIREINLTGAKMLGVPRSELINRRFSLYFSAAETNGAGFGSFLERVFESKVEQECALTLRTGAKRTQHVGIQALAIESGEACRVVVTDITARKEAETNHLILNKLESTGILAGGIAHDFNNMLAVLLLNIELAQTLHIPNEKLTRYLEEAKETCFQAKDLTEQLLTLAQGRAPVRTPTVLSGVIQKSVRLALSGSNSLGEIFLAGDLRAAHVDAGQIGQVIRNLVLNAREAMPVGGTVTIRAENVTFGANQQQRLPLGDYVRITVKDQGPGMSHELLAKIFDPYFSTKQRGDQKGMGLGLTICHAIVHKHGGAICVNSEPGAGSTFDIYLPAGEALITPEPPLISESSRNARVLVMDDEDTLRKVIGMVLTNMGHEVEMVEDGQSAIEAYQNGRATGRPFDVVILDLTAHEG